MPCLKVQVLTAALYDATERNLLEETSLLLLLFSLLPQCRSLLVRPRSETKTTTQVLLLEDGQFLPQVYQAASRPFLLGQTTIYFSGPWALFELSLPLCFGGQNQFPKLDFAA